VRFKHKNGHWVQVDVRGMPIADEQGNLRQMVYVARDVAAGNENEP